MSPNQQQQRAEPRTASRDVRRKQLIMATIDSISKQGSAGTTLKQVTQGANLSRGVVDFHCENKETLSASLDRRLRELAEGFAVNPATYFFGCTGPCNA